MENTCKDCQNFLPVDVFKGICKVDKKPIQQETQACEEFDRVPKCKFCINYVQDKEFLGFCSGSTVTYPDLIAGHCEMFSWIPLN